MELTVSAGLDGGFNVTNALDCNTVLIITVDVLVLEFTDFVEQNSKLVGYIRYILVASLAPNGKLLLEN